MVYRKKKTPKPNATPHPTKTTNNNIADAEISHNRNDQTVRPRSTNTWSRATSNTGNRQRVTPPLEPRQRPGNTIPPRGNTHQVALNEYTRLPVQYTRHPKQNWVTKRAQYIQKTKNPKNTRMQPTRTAKNSGKTTANTTPQERWTTNRHTKSNKGSSKKMRNV